MTMPHLMNCEHLPEGRCEECQKKYPAPQECDDDHHMMMNGPRVSQSLPPEYLQNLINLVEKCEENKMKKKLSAADKKMEIEHRKLGKELNNSILKGVLTNFQDRVYKTAVDHGFCGNTFDRNCMLIVSELGEAVEADRIDDPKSNHIPEFSGREEELADVIIRTLMTASDNNLDVIGAMLAKADFNDNRPLKHGGKKY